MMIMLLLIFMCSFALETFVLSKEKEREERTRRRNLERQEKLERKKLEFEEFKRYIESLPKENEEENKNVSRETSDDLYDYNDLIEQAKIALNQRIQERLRERKEYVISDYERLLEEQEEKEIRYNYINFRDSLSTYSINDVKVAFY